MLSQNGQSVNFGTSVSRVKTPPPNGKEDYCETMASSEHKNDGDSTLVFLNNFMTGGNQHEQQSEQHLERSLLVQRASERHAL